MKILIMLLPILLLVIVAAISRNLLFSMICASVLAVVLECGIGSFTGYIDHIYEVLGNSTLQYILIFAVLAGAMIKLLEKSGAMTGFSKIINRLANTQRKSMFLTWLLGGIIFIDDYLNALAVSTTMIGITDKQKVPREHLAYTVNSMGACVCVMLPVTSWAACAISTLKDINIGKMVYIQAIPFMFYPIAAILICLLLALGIFPKLGNMKKAYTRVEQGGDTLDEISRQNNPEVETKDHMGNAWFFIVPMVVLVAVTIVTGINLVAGLFATLLTQGILYIATKTISFQEYFECVVRGAESMTEINLVIVLAFVMNLALSNMGFSDSVISFCSENIIPQLLPVIVFLAVAFLAYVTANFWALVVLTIPIFVPMAVKMGVNPAVIVGAIMSGVAFGSHCCMYADSVFMTSVGTGVNNLVQVKAMLPYAVIGGLIATVLFLVTGFIM